MKLADGSSSWVIIPLLGILLFGIGSLFLSNILQTLSVFLFFIALVMEVVFLIFFRDPDRQIGPGLVAVADGKIQFIQEIHDEELGESIKIATFMNIHNVHVNRMPIDGTIKKITHIPGGYVPAFKKESERNERVVTLVDTPIGTIKIIQIAGTLAKRIIWYVKNGQLVKKGQRFGMIKLGSRVDIVIPKDLKDGLSVSIGDRVLAGVDTICKLP
jgi:phosphatidylserine decarboxylase